MTTLAEDQWIIVTAARDLIKVRSSNESETVVAQGYRDGYRDNSNIRSRKKYLTSDVISKIENREFILITDDVANEVADIFRQSDGDDIDTKIDELLDSNDEFRG